MIVYGIAFLFVERENSHRRAYANSVYDIDLKTAMLIGCFQCLSLIPGTSRSGSTILGAIILGVGRAAGAEFSFSLAIPTMLGASVLKLVKFLLSGVSATGAEWAILAVGCVVSFVREEFGQIHLKDGGDVRIFGDDTVRFDGEKRKLAFQCGSL